MKVMPSDALCVGVIIGNAIASAVKFMDGQPDSMGIAGWMAALCFYIVVRMKEGNA